MGTAVGIQTVLGTSEESTYGTPVTVDRFYEILPGETLDRQNLILQSDGLRGGTRNLRRGSRRVLTGRSGSGGLSLEVPTTTFGRWLKHLMGGTPTVVQQAATIAYLHTYAMGDLTGKSLTIQKQIRDASNAEVESFTFHGCKITQGTFSISVDQILQAAFDIDAEDVDTAIAAASASYSNVSLFHFAQGTLSVAGSPVANVHTAEVTIANPMNVDRRYIGNQGLKSEPITNDFAAVTGTLGAEFTSPTTFYDRFAADSAASLQLKFEGATIASTYKYSFIIDIPEVRFTGEAPKVSSPDVLVQSIPFEAQYDGTNAGTTISYLTTDTAV